MNINELVGLAKLGDMNAKEKILVENSAFIRKVISDTLPVFKYSNIGYADLVQEGYISMLNAIDSFDFDRNVGFLTYAYYVIRSNLLNVLEDSSRFIRIPGDTFWSLKRYVAVYKDLEIKLRRKPSDEEIAKEMNLSVDRVRYLSKFVNNVISIEEVNDNDLAYEDSFDKNVLIDELSFKINEVFDKLDLSDRELEIIKLRFGFYDRVYSLREIGVRFNIKHQRVYQIVNRVIEKIRLTKCAEELVSYTDDSDYYMKGIEDYRNRNKRKRKVLLK